MKTRPHPRTALGRVALLAAIHAFPACLSPPPSQVLSPDLELEDALERLHTLRGDSFDTRTPRGRASAEQEAEIIVNVHKLALNHPRHVPVLLANAALRYEARDAIGAQKYLDQALALDPGNIQATLLRIRIAAEKGNLPYARRRLRQQLELTPDSPELHQAYGGVLYLAGDHEAALSELDVADQLRGSPDPSGQTSYHRGLILEASGDVGAARAQYRLSHELDPHFEPAARRWRWLETQSPVPTDE